MHPHRAIPCVAVGLLLAACAGGGASTTASNRPTLTSVGAKAYVSAVCGAVLTWGNSIKSRTDTLPAQLSSIKSLDDGKRILTDDLDGIVQDTNTMLATVQHLGPPAVANGKAVQAKVIDALHAIQSTFVEAETKARGLPTDSPSAFASGAEDIGRSIDAELSGLGDRVLGVQESQELSKAADTDPSCQQLGSL